MMSIIASKLKVEDGETVELTCTVPDLWDNIVIRQNNINRAVQIAGNEFADPDPAYTVTKSGTTQVTFRILQFSKSRDVGSWVIIHGLDTSTPVILSAFKEMSIIASKLKVEDGETVELTCTVPDFLDNIVILQNNIPRAAKNVGEEFADPDPAYTVTESGTTQVTFRILQFSKSRDVGSWVISHGLDTSTPVILSAFKEMTTDTIVNVVAGSVAAVGVTVVAGIIYAAKRYCTKKNKETIHAEFGTNVTLGYTIPDAGKVVWTKNGGTFGDDPIENVDVNGTVVQMHKTMPEDSGFYVCNYGHNSEKLQFELVVKELEKKDSA